MLKPEILRQLQSIFALYKGVKEVVLYGSRAKETHTERSDIDRPLEKYNYR